MGKQESVTKFTGTIDELSYYKQDNEYRVRKKGGPTPTQYKESATFEAARHHGHEFGRASKGGKLIRTAFRDIIRTASDAHMNSRLNKLLLQIVKTDTVHARGERTIVSGQKEKLKDFDFNNDGKFRQCFHGMYSATVNKSAGTFTFHVPSFSPSTMLTSPPSYTHFRIVAMAAAFNFDKNEFISARVESGMIDLKTENVESLTFTQALDAGDLPVLITVGIQFFDETNGHFHPCLVRRYNSVAVVEVDVSVRVKLDEAKGAEKADGAGIFNAGTQGRNERRVKTSGEVIDIDASIFGDGWVQELHLN